VNTPTPQNPNTAMQFVDRFDMSYSLVDSWTFARDASTILMQFDMTNFSFERRGHVKVPVARLVMSLEHARQLQQQLATALAQQFPPPQGGQP
jgi:hypothetical protein